MSVRVLVVDDSRFYRRRVSEILSSDIDLEVVGTASDGAEAVELTKSLRPDVVTMDVDMPVMDGITATRRIMEFTPTPILMFSGLTTTGARATLDALDAGAVDYIPKRFDEIADHQDNAIATLCRRIHQLKLIKQCFEKQKNEHSAITQPASAQAIKNLPFNLRHYRILVIGTSTGGPVALQSILTRLPKNFPLPILLIQHMPGNFTPAFAQRLDQLCEIKIKEAVKGEVLHPGTAYLAPGGYQTTVTGSMNAMRLLIERAESGQIYKPCIDTTYDSLSKMEANRVLAIVLTGMGSDGAKGSVALKLGGATIWAQDIGSSLVASMPSSVIETGVVDRIMSLNEIGSVLAGPR